MAWHLGRLGTYSVLGALAGAFGSVLPGPSWVAAAISSLLLIWFAGALAGLVPEPTLRIPGVRRLASRAAGSDGFSPGFILGLATGLLPCGLVYAALAIPVASGSPLAGALSMVAFGLGTVPALMALSMGARRLLLRDLRARRVLAAGVLLLGLASVGMRQGLGPGHGPPSAHSHTPAIQAPVVPESSTSRGPIESGDVP